MAGFDCGRLADKQKWIGPTNRSELLWTTSYCRLHHRNVLLGIRICIQSRYLPLGNTPRVFTLVGSCTLLPLFAHLQQFTLNWMLKTWRCFPFLNQQINVVCFISIRDVVCSQFVLYQVHQLMSFHFMKNLKVSCLYKYFLGNFESFLDNSLRSGLLFAYSHVLIPHYICMLQIPLHHKW